MDFYVSRNQTLFTLHYTVFCTNTRDSRICLFIFPQDVKSITSENTYPNVLPSPNISLRFTMSKPPTLKIPAETKPKPQYLHIVQTLMTLASLRDFTVYIDSFNLGPDRRALFSSLPSVFSGLKYTSTPATVEQFSPPPYHHEPSSPAQTSAESTHPDRKRRLSSDSPSPSANKRILHTLDNLLHRVDRLEDMTAPCRYNSEEQEDIINHVNETVDDQLANVHVQILEMEENTEEMQNRLTFVGEEIREEVAEVRHEVAGVEDEVAEMRKEVEEVAGIRNRRVRATEIQEEVAKVRQEVVEMRQEMREELEQTREEMREMRKEMKELFKLLMSGACGGGGGGGNEKARVSFNAGSQASDDTQ